MSIFCERYFFRWRAFRAGFAAQGAEMCTGLGAGGASSFAACFTQNTIHFYTISKKVQT